MFLAFTLLAAICFTTGGALMKTSDGLTRLWPSLGCLGVFAVGAALQALAMRGNQMGITHIFVLGLEAALALAFGAVFFQETITLAKLGGTLLIVGGMIILRVG